MADPPFLAIDWGTTNRRVYLIGADGTVIAEEHDDHGVLAVPADHFGVEVAAIRARMGDLPMLCAGMVGSTRGWVEAPYLACPADAAALTAALHWIDPRTAIVPGLSTVATIGNGATRSDVMRGEEVQFLGAILSSGVPDDALLCQPGTHCKWARTEHDKITDFRTAMTGEMFALLHKHSLLADFLTGAVGDGPAFRAGIAASRYANLLNDLFGVRADVLLGRRSREDTPSYVSGLLIGSDVRAQKIAPGSTAYVLADAALGVLYCAALEAEGVVAVAIQSRAAFVAGMTHIWNMIDASKS